MKRPALVPLLGAFAILWNGLASAQAQDLPSLDLWVVSTGDALLLGIVPGNDGFPPGNDSAAHACSYRITQGTHVWDLTVSLGEPSRTTYNDGSFSVRRGCALDFPDALPNPGEAAWPSTDPVVVDLTVSLGSDEISLGPQTIRSNPRLPSWEAVETELAAEGIQSLPNDTVVELTQNTYTHFVTLHASDCPVVTGVTQGRPEADSCSCTGGDGETCCHSGPGIRVSMTAYPDCPESERARVFELVGSLLSP